MKRLVATLLLALAAPAAFAQRADLVKARNFYNQRQFDAAIESAGAAQKLQATADAATVVLARAHLERYRERANPDDLAAARLALGNVRPASLDARDTIDFLTALGEALFFEDEYGAAAAVFESGIDRAVAQDRAHRDEQRDRDGRERAVGDDPERSGERGVRIVVGVHGRALKR